MVHKDAGGPLNSLALQGLALDTCDAGQEPCLAAELSAIRRDVVMVELALAAGAADDTREQDRLRSRLHHAAARLGRLIGLPEEGVE